MDLSSAVHWLSSLDPITVGALLLGVSFLEPVVPGVPGDVVALAAAVMVFGFGWSFWPVVLALVVGGLLGGLFNYGLGAWLRRTDRLSWLGRTRPVVDQALAGFERRGPALLALNRFFPGIRGFFFIAAGLQGLGWRSVALWGGLGSVVWYALLFAVGGIVGTNLEALESILVAQGWLLGTLMVLGFAGYALYRRLSPERLPMPDAG